MRQYELTVILGTEENETSAGKEKVEELLKKKEAKIGKSDDLGVRDLAYTIKKKDKGHYYYYEFEMEPESAYKMEEELRIANPLLKHLLIKKER
jgi:small subunit ribosomal protein S6